MNEKIGVIDSGMGGLTVVRSLLLRNVPADIIYIGDNANVPYGNRPLDEIVELTSHMLEVLS
nr:glutamate racemase [Rectinema sp.]